MTTQENYTGFEQGPIRPPSEAQSLLIRITRNCPWNHCTFCPVYKGSQFSLRPKAHVIQDIDAIHKYVDMLNKGNITRDAVFAVRKKVPAEELRAFHAAVNWISNGMESVFLQDANSLIIKPQDLAEILRHLKHRFPQIKRITSYARSHTIARISDDDLKEIADAGLNRIHIGLESGSDEVLKMVKKGVSKDMHIKAGLKVKKAKIELSEYVMPGLGGQALSKIHAIETADALNQINPHFIRLRSLAIPEHIPLFEDWQSGRFIKCTDRMTAEEILLFIEHLSGITSTLVSDHILNLFQDITGVFPHDKEKMADIPRTFLDMSPQEQCVYQVGRRMGIFSGLSDMADPNLLETARLRCQEFGITPDNVDELIDELMKRFI
jgi:histone acetyltransferase (RNA polymerase elongator complex component)